MKWTSDRTAAEAAYDCQACGGLGYRSNRIICSCVYRSVFRTCHRTFRHCAAADPHARKVTFERTSKGVDRSLSWARRYEDFCADFQAAGNRALPVHLSAVFRFHHLQGATPALLARRLGLQVSNLLTMIYEVEILVGREIAHAKPYSLFPPYDYLRAGDAGRDAAAVDARGALVAV